MTNLYASFFSLLFLIESQSKPSINDYLDAVGGMEKWESLETLVIKSEINYYTRVYSSSGSELKAEKSYSRKVITSAGKFFQESNSLMNGKRKVAYNGHKLKEKSADGFVYEDPDEILNQYKMREIHLGEPWIAIHADEVSFVGEESDEKNDYLVFLVTRLNFDRKYYILKDSKLLFKVVLFDGKTQAFFEDYRVVDGYKIPFKISGYVNGILEHETTVTEVVVNSKIVAGVFEIR